MSTYPQITMTQAATIINATKRFSDRSYRHSLQEEIMRHMRDSRIANLKSAHKRRADFALRAAQTGVCSEDAACVLWDLVN